MDTQVLMIAGLVVATVVLAAAALRSALAREGELLQGRIARAVRTSSTIAVAGSPRAARGRSLVAGFLRPLSRLLGPREASADYSRAKRQLGYAGLRGPHTVELFFGVKLVACVVFCGGMLALGAWRFELLPRPTAWAVMAAAVGFYGPNVWLRRRVRTRQTALSRSLPDTLDLLVTCVEAGLGLDAALARVTQEIGLSAPVLSDELGLTTSEIEMGIPRTDAFRRLADRTGLEELRGLSAMLIQTDLFGTSVAKALRVHAGSMRVRRTHQAEERAATVSVKMMLPLILFILPALFAVILGPAVVRIVRALLPAIGADG